MKKKLVMILFSLLLLIGLAGTFWGAQIVEAASGVWNSCPRGQVDCAFPGKCRLYIDTNGDSLCDRSQSDPAASAAGTGTDSTSVISGPISTVLAVTATAAPESAAAVNADTAVVDSAAPSAASQVVGLKHSYYFVPVFLVLAVLYALTWTLAARKIIRTLTHRKIWNFVLMISMVVSALLGLFLILNIDFNFGISLPVNMLFWHVEAGIALGVIGAFHILWHWRYFAKLLKAGEKTAGSPA
jgi:hypothetical protein